MAPSSSRHLRVSLSEDDFAAFLDAKCAAERETQIVMSNAQFAAGLIRWALREKGRPK